MLNYMLWWTLHRLKSKNRSARMAAAVKLGEKRARRAVPALLKALDDDDAAVRIAVAGSLASIPHSAAVEPLVSALERAAGTRLGKTETGQEEYKALAEALVAQGRGAVPFLSRLLESAHHNARLWASWSLGRVGGADAAAALAGALEDRRSDVRQQAAAALGEIADPTLVDALVRALSHRDPDTRRAAAAALSGFNDEKVLTPLESATRDIDEGVQRAAVGALARIGTVSAALRLKAAVESERKGVREAALAAARSTSLHPRDTRESVALAVLRGDYTAAATEGEAALPALLDAIQSKDAERRAGAVRAMERLRSVDAIQSLVLALRDPVRAVRDSAEDALVAAGHSAVGALVEALSSEDMGVQSHAAAALGRIGDRRAVKALAGLIRKNGRSPSGYDGPVEAARSAAEALKTILQGDAAALSEEELRGLCEVPDAVVERQSPEDPHMTLEETAVDCAPVRALAQRELSRRLGWS
jgi:HEAT repeat protein